MKRTLLAVLSVILIAGCQSTEQVAETKPGDVHQNISQEQQDKIAQSFKDWKPDKKK